MTVGSVNTEVGKIAASYANLTPGEGFLNSAAQSAPLNSKTAHRGSGRIETELAHRGSGRIETETGTTSKVATAFDPDPNDPPKGTGGSGARFTGA